MKVKKYAIAFSLLVFSLIFLKVEIVKADTTLSPSIGVSYQAHVSDIGWQSTVKSNDTAGTTGQGLRMEAIKISMDNPLPGMKLKYEIHVENLGWLQPVYDGQLGGTTGQGLRMEAIKISLENAPADYHVQYQAHVENYGWMDWTQDGQIAGTTGKGLRIEALRVRIVKQSDNTAPTIGVNYQSHVENIGWQQIYQAGQTSGTTGQGLRIEALKINLSNATSGMKVRYEAHVENYGWMAPVYDGQVAGTTGQGLRVEALKVNLENAPLGYHIQYQVHVENIGWMDWAQDGEIAGTTGKSLRIEAIRIRIIKDFGAAGITYNKTLDQMVDCQYNLPKNNGKPVAEVYNDTTKSSTWVDASIPQIEFYMNPRNFMDEYGKYQFMTLNYTSGATVDEVNSMLVGKGILEGKGQYFLKASLENNISVFYLVSHALLETGNGTSVLATGGQRQDNTKPISDTNKPIYGVPVYNMFGIAAVDSDPIGNGTKYAYDQKWFTPEDAIVGGAKWIATRYVNSTTYRQNTLYKMRWNPSNPGNHQYATDVAWSYSQVRNIKSLVDKCKNIIINYEVPVFSN